MEEETSAVSQQEMNMFLDADPGMMQDIPTHFEEIIFDHEINETGTLEPFQYVYEQEFALLEDSNLSYENERPLAQKEQVHLVLYCRPTCYYCRKVTGYLNSIGKTIPMKNISQDPQAAKELVKIGGKRQVPCLVINGRALYESSDIIEYLKKNQDKY